MGKENRRRARRRGALAEVLREPEDAQEPQDKGVKLQEALAEYFGIEPEQVNGWVVAVEWDDPAVGGMSLSSVWSAQTPVWRLESFAREILLALGGKLRAGHSSNGDLT